MCLVKDIAEYVQETGLNGVVDNLLSDLKVKSKMKQIIREFADNMHGQIAMNSAVRSERLSDFLKPTTRFVNNCTNPKYMPKDMPATLFVFAVWRCVMQTTMPNMIVFYNETKAEALARKNKSKASKKVDDEKESDSRGGTQKIVIRIKMNPAAYTKAKYDEIMDTAFGKKKNKKFKNRKRPKTPKKKTPKKKTDTKKTPRVVRGPKKTGKTPRKSKGQTGAKTPKQGKTQTLREMFAKAATLDSNSKDEMP